jgi:hypothetical protein
MKSSEEIQVTAAKDILTLDSLSGLTISRINPALSFHTRSQGKYSFDYFQ